MRGNYITKYMTSDFRKTFQEIGNDAMGFIGFKATESYKTLESFIADRDFPLSEIECLCIYKQVTGFWPKKEQVAVMNPDNYRAVQDYRLEQAADYYSIYG